MVVGLLRGVEILREVAIVKVAGSKAIVTVGVGLVLALLKLEFPQVLL